MATVRAAPEDRQYFVRVLGRVEFEVNEEEYQRVIAQVFRMDPFSGPSHMTFETSTIGGFFVDPPDKKEEVVDSGGRT